MAATRGVSEYDADNPEADHPRTPDIRVIASGPLSVGARDREPAQTRTFPALRCEIGVAGSAIRRERAPNVATERRRLAGLNAHISAPRRRVRSTLEPVAIPVRVSADK
jgi:hypothetical protein